jgi:glycosyltransferase involved in cell wall biosynthesis
MNTYFRRYAYPGKLFYKKPSPNLKISVVIPCFNEPDIISTLNSLNKCQPVEDVEVIIIINEPETCSSEIQQQNQVTLKEIKDWQQDKKLNFTLLHYYLTMPDKDAGVGLARKVGMDEAARRFEEIENRTGVICCFDADSICSGNYFKAIYHHFYEAKVKPHGAAIYFEHLNPETDYLKKGINQYELHLRYYVHALRYIGYPFAHQTVGSAMAVRSDIYQKVGGMNKRKAGEDFYFLHRVMPTGAFIDIEDTTVYPSARISSRVPFGTGKAMARWTSATFIEYNTYDLQSFIDLKVLLKRVSALYQIKLDDLPEFINELPASIRSFLTSFDFAKVVERLNRQSNSPGTFNNNWYRYFDGFKILKFLHHARDHSYKKKPVVQEAGKLIRKRWPTVSLTTNSVQEYLDFYRRLDRGY